MKTLISERLCLRPVTTRDFPAMAAMDSDPNVMRYLRLKSPVPTYGQALEEQHCILELSAPQCGYVGDHLQNHASILRLDLVGLPW